MKDDKIELLIHKLLNKMGLKLDDSKEILLIQIFKFIIVGGIATIIDWIIYYACYNYFKINPLISNIISFSISVIYNHIASVKWVFDVKKDKSKKRMFIEFMIFSIIGLVLTELLLLIFINKLEINKMISKIIATIIVMIFNFITRKKFLE